MPTKKREEWKSVVARTLRLRSQPAYESAAARFADRNRSGLEAPEIAAKLARKLRESEGDAGALGPVDLTHICTVVGLAVEYMPLGVDAILQETGSGYLALVNSTVRPSRQKMSLAHEIGHLMLYKETGLREAFGHTIPEERHSNEAQEIEKLCDSFAAELVLPSEVWDREIRINGLSLATLRELMMCYGITLATAARRMVEVATYDCAVIAWTPVYENDRLVSIDYVRSWSRLPVKRLSPRSIKDEEVCCVPGSPLRALKEQAATFGKLSLDGVAGRYFANSDVIDSKYLATIILPEVYGQGVMRGARGAVHL